MEILQFCTKTSIWKSTLQKKMIIIWLGNAFRLEQHWQYFADIFKSILLNKKKIHFALSFSEVCVSEGPICNKPALNRQQAITQTNDDPVYWCWKYGSCIHTSVPFMYQQWMSMTLAYNLMDKRVTVFTKLEYLGYYDILQNIAS